MTIKITLPCAYCARAITFTQASIELRSRGDEFAALKCPHCDSTFTVELSTKRKSKGRRQRAAEAQRESEGAALVELRRAENAREGADLLAEPGCACGPEIERRRAAGYTSMLDRGKGTGHPLSTGWSRDRRTDTMLPTRPRHLHGCPRYDVKVS